MFYEKTVLDNGVTVISERMPGVRSITMGLWFQVGSRDETPAQAGMSHFMEHMMFKGTTTRDAMAISSAFEGLGAELNAFTSHEFTCYYARFVDDKLPLAMELMGDMVCHSTYEESCCTSEREVVIEEIARSEDTPDDHIWDLYEDALMPTHPLGRPVIGTRAVVGGFGQADCLAYRDAHYRSGNLTVVLTGNVDHAEAVRLASEHLADLPVGPRMVRPASIEDAQRDHVFLHRDTEQSHLIIGMPAYHADSPQRYAASLLDCALGGGMSSRLFQEVREKRGLAYAVFCQMQEYTDTGTFSIYAGTRPSNLTEVVSVIDEVLEGIVEHGIGEEELVRVHDYATGQMVLAMESTRTRMTRLGKESVMNVDLISLDETIAGYDAVTCADVEKVAADLLVRPRTMAVIGPQSEEEMEALFARRA